MSCAKNEPVSLARRDVVKRLKTQHGLILAHDPGTGKTIKSIAAAEQFPNVPVLVLCPAGLVSNFHKEMDTYCVANQSRYTVMSYHAFLARDVNCQGVFLICDEAHRLRSNGQISSKVLTCAQKAVRVLLLTATPVVNTPADTINLFAMAMNEAPIAPHAFERLWRSKDVHKLKPFISFLHQNQTDYPNVRVHEVRIKMPQDFYREYHRIEQQQFKGRPASSIIDADTDVFAFLSGIRRAANAASVTQNPKIDWVKNKVSQGGKFIIYSEWIKAGADLIRRAFPHAGVITGQMPNKERDAIVRAYNNNTLNVLFVSAAGGEGLDLKGTTDVILFEVPFNEARERQVIGRAARYKSHTGKQTVNVWKLVLEKPGPGLLSSWTGRAWTDGLPSADQWVLDLLNKKRTLNKEFEARLRA